MSNETVVMVATVVLAVATVALVVLTAALVGVTSDYARQTRRMVDEMRAGRELAPAPVLTCELEPDDARTAAERATTGRVLPGLFLRLRVRNVGNAPALVVEARLTPKNPDVSLFRVSAQAWPPFTLGIDQERTLPLNRIDPLNRVEDVLAGEAAGERLAEPEVVVSLVCHNSYGVRFETVAEFARQEDRGRPASAGVEHPGTVWVKRSETVRYDPRRSVGSEEAGGG